MHVEESKDFPWLVLRTKSRHEKVVELYLQQRRIKAYLPKYMVLRSWKSRKQVVKLPLFPGYIFVQPTPQQHEQIRCIRGSCGFIYAGSGPAKICEDELEAVKLLVDSGENLEVNQKLVPGRRVEVTAGPFMGARGQLVRVKNEERLVVNVELINRSVSVEIDSDTISLI